MILLDAHTATVVPAIATAVVVGDCVSRIMVKYGTEKVETQGYKCELGTKVPSKSSAVRRIYKVGAATDTNCNRGRRSIPRGRPMHLSLIYIPFDSLTQEHFNRALAHVDEETQAKAKRYYHREDAWRLSFNRFLDRLLNLPQAAWWLVFSYN